jgi:glycosyltransferase involved in cell wall biosynthesis
MQIDIYQYCNNFQKIEDTDYALLYGDLNAVHEPLLSIIITLYKRRGYFLDAVTSAIRQENVDIEYEIIVICDDPDAVINMADNFDGVKNIYFYKNSRNIGLYNSCNLGVKIARGKYIAFLHDDDILYPNYIFEVCKFISSISPRAECIIINRDTIGGRQRKDKIKKIEKIFLIIIFFIFYLIRFLLRDRYKLITLKEGLTYQLSNIYKAPSCGVCFEKKSFINSGGFNQAFWPVSDYFFFLKFNKDHKIYMIRQKLACYRWLDNLSQNKKIQFMNLEMLNKFFKSRQPIESINRYFSLFNNELVYVKYLMIDKSFRSEIDYQYPEVTRLNKIRWIIFKIFNIIFRFFHDIV